MLNNLFLPRLLHNKIYLCNHLPRGVIYQSQFAEIVAFMECIYGPFSMNNYVYGSSNDYVPGSAFVALVEYWKENKQDSN